MFTYDITEMSPHVVRVILLDGGDEKGVLYFERAKKTFTSKPLSLNQWVCVDAKVSEDIYMTGDISPKIIVNLCQKKIKEGGY